MKRRRSPAWRRYLRFWGNDSARDLDDELHFHLDARYDEYIASGLDAAAARVEVEKRFGDVSRFREQCANIDSRWARERNLGELVHLAAADFRHATRQLLRTPSLTIAGILCFALGIGANTSIFSVVDAVLFRPLPFLDADRLVLVGEGLPRFGHENFGVISAPEFVDYQRLAGRTFDRLAMYQAESFALGGGDAEPERVAALRASAALFDVLGVHAARGRTFVARDDSLGAPSVALISDALWRRRFGGDGGVIGRSVDVDGRATTIVGVLPAAVRFPLPGVGGDAAELFVPYPITAAVQQQLGNAYNSFLIARLAAGVTLTAARRDVADVAAHLPAFHSDVLRHDWLTVADVFPFRQRAVRDVQKPLLILLGAVGIVLLIACINVSSLLLARAATRRREIAVRQALGASRWRLVQQSFAESLLLAGAGATLGVLFAMWGARALAMHAPHALPQGHAASVDPRVLGVTALVVIATAFIFSVLPAATHPAGSLGAALRDDVRTTGSATRQHGRRALVVTQIALALILAAGAGLMARSFVRALSVDAGFDPGQTLTFRIGLPDARFPTRTRMLAATQNIVDGLRAIPAVAAVSATTALPMTQPSRVAFALDGVTMPTIPVARGELVIADYFKALRIPLRAGRAFGPQDVRGALQVVVVNQTLAHRYFGDQTAVGHRLKWGTPGSSNPWLTIIGVTADVKTNGLDQPLEPVIYFPLVQQDSVAVGNLARTLAYVVRVNGDPLAAFNDVRRAVRAVDPALPIIGLERLTDVVDVSIADRRFNTVLLGAFAVLALLLAAVGIYGLVAYTVVQRTREIGIRVAIGATSADVVAMIVGQGARLACAGVMIGLAGALALAHVVRTLLFDVSPFDPLSFAAAAMVLLAVAAMASYLPARRAAKVDPQLAMRSE